MHDEVVLPDWVEPFYTRKSEWFGASGAAATAPADLGHTVVGSTLHAGISAAQAARRDALSYLVALARAPLSA